MAAVDLYSLELREDAENAVSTVGGAAVAKLFDKGLWVVSGARLQALLKTEKAHLLVLELAREAREAAPTAGFPS